MAGRGSGVGHRIYVWTCWIPVAAFFLTKLALRRYEGWGAWAAAPLFLLPIILSASMLAVGIALAAQEHRAGLAIRWTVTAAALAGSVFAWFLLRALSQ